MALDRSGEYMKPAFRVGAAALGSFLAGPLGCATGAFLGGMLGDIFGQSAAALVATCAEKFGEATAEKMLGSQLDSLAERFREHKQPQIEKLYREAFRESLIAIHFSVGREFEDWFENWEACLKSSQPLDLEGIQPAQLVPTNLDDLLKRTMQSLDRLGDALRAKNQSLIAEDLRNMPPLLLREIETHLAGHFKTHFRALIVRDEYKQAWKEAELDIREYSIGLLEQINQTTVETRKMVEFLYQKALAEGKTEPLGAEDREKEIARLTSELQNLKDQLAARPAEPSDAELSVALDLGDLDSALRLKSRQVELRSGRVKRLKDEAAKLPRDLYELGTIHELRFEWPQALAAFREAWELGEDTDHGFKFAHFAQKLNHFNEAIAAYESLLRIYKAPSDRAVTLNNLAVLYRATQRLKQAEGAYAEALGIRRKLAEANPEAYLPDVAMTLNNLAILYSDTQRLQQAGEAYSESLDVYRKLAQANPEAYLPDVAMTLNNLGLLYRATQRLHEAEEVYAEALGIYRKLAEANPEAYLPYVAGTINNLANLYSDTQRLQHAGEAYAEALGIYRKLAETNPEAYLPDVAMTLNNLGLLYSDTQRLKEADEAYAEALCIRRKLAEANPEAYLPYVATTLNNLANLYSDTQRLQQAGGAYAEALGIYRKLAQANPGAHLPDVAMTLNNLGALYYSTQRQQQAGEAYAEALGIYRKLAETNPEAWLPDVAMTLNNLAILYSDTQRLQQAGEAYSEALSIRRKLAEANPQAYLPNVATTLNNLGVLYKETQRLQQAGEAYAEALGIRRKLAEANPEAYLPDVASTLNNLAYFQFSQGRIEEAQANAMEAERILTSLWHANPELHGNRMARTLSTRALIAEAGQLAPEACALARRALAAAYDPGLKQSIQEIIDRLCPNVA
jgi:tetratricopeptide (TPR) repeat protein